MYKTQKGLTTMTAIYARRRGVSKKEAREALITVFDIMSDAIVEGGISIKNQFAIERVHREARVGRNPQTGESIRLEPTITARLRLGDMLKERLKNSGQ